MLPISKLKRLEKLSLKVRKAKLDINFLLNSINLNVKPPKFLYSNLYHNNDHDTKSFHKKNLRSDVRKRNHGKFKMNRELDRSINRNCSAKKGVLRNFEKFTGKHLCQGLFFHKVAGP